MTLNIFNMEQRHKNTTIRITKEKASSIAIIHRVLKLTAPVNHDRYQNQTKTPRQYSLTVLQNEKLAYIFFWINSEVKRIRFQSPVKTREAHRELYWLLSSKWSSRLPETSIQRSANFTLSTQLWGNIWDIEWAALYNCCCDSRNALSETMKRLQLPPRHTDRHKHPPR